MYYIERSYVIQFIFKLRYITSDPEAGITLRTDHVVHGKKHPQSKIRNSSLDRNQHEEGYMLSHDGTGITGPQHHRLRGSAALLQQ